MRIDSSQEREMNRAVFSRPY